MDNANRFERDKQKSRPGVSWAAILAGTITVIATLLVLNLIGMAIGLSTIQPTEEANPLSGIGTGMVIWWVLSCIIALFAGGYVAGRVGVSFTNTAGVVQGVMTWAVFTVVSVWMLTTLVGNIISGVGSAAGTALTTTGDMAEQVAPMIEDQLGELDLTMEQAREEFLTRMEEAGVDPDDIEDAEIDAMFSDAISIVMQGDEAMDRQAMEELLTEHTDMDENEVNEAVDTFVAQYEETVTQAEEALADAEDTAREAAEEASQAMAEAAAYLSIALILGAIAAGFGGIFGVKQLRESVDDYDYVYDPDDPDYDDVDAERRHVRSEAVRPEDRDSKRMRQEERARHEHHEHHEHEHAGDGEHDGARR